MAEPSITEQEEEEKTEAESGGGRNKVEGGGKKFQMSNSKVCSHWSLVYLLLKPLAPHCCCPCCSCSCCCRCPIISTLRVPKCVTASEGGGLVRFWQLGEEATGFFFCFFFLLFHPADTSVDKRSFSRFHALLPSAVHHLAGLAGG